ncbi:hypothetical protein [Streptomyces sp. NPDC029674]|uniref:hypothetical protein n=1 Tax=Streptomyces sp. NPDC029674 TaxID=3365297 RepID=UPI00384BB895
MNAGDFLTLMRKITDVQAHVRERGADETTDWVHSYSAVEASSLATVLAAAAVSEKDHAALEAQLHAILELASTGYVQASHIARFREIDLEEFPAPLQGYVTDLLESA